MAFPEHVVVSIPANSGVARDTIMMDFNFQAPTAGVAANVIKFFNTTVAPATDTLASFLSPWLSRGTNACMVEEYNATPPAPPATGFGPPFNTVPFTLGPSLGTPLPQEVQVALSYHAIDGSIPEHGPGTRPKSRYRGRLYVGPLITTAQDFITANHKCFVSALFRTNLKANAAALLQAEPTWGVWSRVDHVIRPIVGGWIDDDFDIQRRRGTDADTRTTWP